MAGDLDPYVDAGTRVLRNKPGLRTEAALRSFEYERSAVRSVQLQERPIQGRYDLDHLKAIHRHLFRDVYDWAGQARTTNLSKGGSSFVRAEAIEPAAAKLTEKLVADKHLQGLDKATFVSRLAEHFAGWNSLHPFREGNGRATREFVGQLARDAGYVLDQRRIDNSKDQWNQAARQAHGGDMRGLEEILKAAVRPARAIAFEAMPRAQALAAHPELRGTFDRLDGAGAILRKQYPGNDRAVHHYVAQAKTEAVRLLDTGKVHVAAAVREVSRGPGADAGAATTQARPREPGARALQR